MKEHFSILAREEGSSNVISLNEPQLSNEFSHIIVTEEGIDIWVNEEQFLKVPSLIVVTEEGIVTCFNEEQS